MDIKVGAVIPAGLPEAAARAADAGQVEAKILAVRPPRGVGGNPVRDRGDERRKRRSGVRSDPFGSRVLMLLVTDPSGIPTNFETVPYRVLVRFLRSE